MTLGLGLNRGLTIGGQSGNWWLSNASLDLDFRSDRAFLNSQVTALSGLVSVTRSGAALAESTDGTWSSFATNTLRRTNKGALIEEASTNGIRNNSNTGATSGVIGSGGVLPTNWITSGTGGLTVTVTTTTRNGLPATRVRFAGTPSATGSLQIRFEGPLVIAALNGQTWTNSAYLALTAGALTNVTSPLLTMIFRDGVGGTLTSANVSAPITSTVVRYQRTATASNASTAFVQNLFTCSVTNGSAIDFEIEVAGVQLEQKGFATSPILTTSAAVTRAADVVTLDSGDAQTAALAAVAAFAQTTGVVSAATTPTVFSFNSGQKAYYATTSSVALNNGTVEALAVIGSVASTSGPVKAAFNFDGTDFSAKANAGVVDNEVADFGAKTGTVRIGANAASGLPLNGYIQRLAFSAVDGAFDNATRVEPGFFDPFTVDGELTSPWMYIEPEVEPQIVRSYVTGGALVADYSGEASTAAYPFVDMGAPVVDMRARVSWAAGTANNAVIALIATPLDTGEVSSITTGPSLHITFTDTRVAVEVFVDDVNTTIQTINFSSVMAKDGTQYVFGWQKPDGGSTMTILMPDGTTATVTDSRLADCGGQYAYCEHFWNGTSGIALPSVHDFYAGTSLVA